MANRFVGRDHSERLESIIGGSVDWRTKTIYISGEVNGEMAHRLIPVIRLLDEDKSQITVVLSSPGGEEAAGFAIFDSLVATQNQVEVQGFGGVYSIAALIFQAGDVRKLGPNAQVMMHNGSIELTGYIDTDKIQELSGDAARNNRRYHRAISTRCDVDLKVVEDWCKVERTFSAQEALEEGLADGIIESWKDL